MKDKFTFYRTFESTANLLPKRARLHWYAAIIAYGLRDEVPLFANAPRRYRRLLCVTWRLAKLQMDDPDCERDALWHEITLEELAENDE